MAKDSSGLILLLGGGALAWYGYTQGWFSSFFGTPTTTVVPVPPAQPNVSPANPPTSSGTPSLPAAATPPPSTLAACGGTGQPACTGANTFALLLNQAAGGSGATPLKLNLDQWSYYYNGLGNTTAITGDQIAAMMKAGGITAATRSTVMMDASQFTALLAGAGVQGLSGVGYGRRPVYFAAPRVTIAGRGFSQYTVEDLRRAGRR